VPHEPIQTTVQRSQFSIVAPRLQGNPSCFFNAIKIAGIEDLINEAVVAGLISRER
jgi:hypothetical protein